MGRKLMFASLLAVLCTCSGNAQIAVENLRLIRVSETDLCFAITGAEKSIAMVQIDCAAIPAEKLRIVEVEK